MPVRARIYVFVLISVTLCGPAQGEEIRDFYSEPGLNPFKETIHHVWPGSGSGKKTTKYTGWPERSATPT